MSLTKVSFSMIQGAPANVLDFGASTTETSANNTIAFQAACDSGATAVYIPQGTFTVSDFNVPEGVSISGPGVLDYDGPWSTGRELLVDFEVPLVPMRAIYCVCVYSYPAILAIKNLGLNTLIHNLQFRVSEGGTNNATTFNLLINNLTAAGMYVIPAAISDTPSAHLLAAIPKDCVYGLYLFDEPTIVGNTKAEQAARIDVYRALTNKPLTIADQSDQGYQLMKTKLDSRWDIIFVDWYYYVGLTGYGPTDASANKGAAIVCWTQRQYVCPQANMIPMVGLFNAGVIFGNKTKNINFAIDFARLSPNGSISIYDFDANVRYPGGEYGNVQSDPDFQDAVNVVCKNAEDGKNRVQLTNYYFEYASAANVNEAPTDGDMGGLLEIYDPTYSNTDVYPFEVFAVSAPNVSPPRLQTWGMSGLFAVDLGGMMAAKPASFGNINMYLYYRSYDNASTDEATIDLRSTVADWYQDAVIDSIVIYDSQTIGSQDGYKTNGNVPAGRAWGLNFVQNATQALPRKAINGAIINSNWTTIDY